MDNTDTLVNIIAVNSNGAKTYHNPGTNNFEAVQPSVVGGSGTNAAFTLGLGDLDSNGFLDIIIGNQLYLNPAGSSPGIFTDVEPKQFAFLDNDVKSVAVSDVDRDVRPATRARYPLP